MNLGGHWKDSSRKGSREGDIIGHCPKDHVTFSNAWLESKILLPTFSHQICCPLISDTCTFYKISLFLSPLVNCFLGKAFWLSMFWTLSKSTTGLGYHLVIGWLVLFPFISSFLFVPANRIYLLFEFSFRNHVFTSYFSLLLFHSFTLSGLVNSVIQRQFRIELHYFS